MNLKRVQDLEIKCTSSCIIIIYFLISRYHYSYKMGFLPVARERVFHKIFENRAMFSLFVCNGKLFLLFCIISCFVDPSYGVGAHRSIKSCVNSRTLGKTWGKWEFCAWEAHVFWSQCCLYIGGRKDFCWLLLCNSIKRPKINSTTQSYF